jgi:hypothetical protein
MASGDGYWKDGDVAHFCGAYIEDHRLENGKSVCPTGMDSKGRWTFDEDLTRPVDGVIVGSLTSFDLGTGLQYELGDGYFSAQEEREELGEAAFTFSATTLSYEFTPSFPLINIVAGSESAIWWMQRGQLIALREMRHGAQEG